KAAVMEVEAKLPNKDIGFVEAGQDAAIKVDSFPFTKYGTLAARVELVSLDAVKDEESQTKEYYFPIRLSVADATIRLENGKRVPLTPGMTVVAEVKTGTRKPIEYVLAPLKKYGAESGRER
ncbi:MAG: HlyD family efflux transporter periplasmic adaptor subunit, partial [Bacteroidales bacterium]